MNHNQRIKIAKEISKDIVKEYGKAIVSIGIYGSVARNEDDEFSDLEMIIVTKGKEFVKHYVDKGITIAQFAISSKNMMKEVRKVDYEWSVRPGCLVYQKVLYGDKSLPNRIRKELKKASKSDLHSAAKDQLTWMNEYLGKINRAAKQNSRGKMLVALAFYTIQANLFVGLLNKYTYKRQFFGAFAETKKFKILPKNFHSLMEILYKNDNLKETSKAASVLYENCKNLLPT